MNCRYNNNCHFSVFTNQAALNNKSLSNIACTQKNKRSIKKKCKNIVNHKSIFVVIDHIIKKCYNNDFFNEIMNQF